MGGKIMEGAFWRDQGLKDLIPHWYEHARDVEYRGFHTNLSRDWRPLPPWDRVPSAISRHVFGFCAAYLLSGEDRYLQVAREGVDYLLKYGWDEKHGGWFNSFSRTGEPLDTSKSIPVQLYTNAGLALYYFTTGDERALSYIKRSIEIQKTYGHDEEFGGYYQALKEDLSVKDDGKNKHAHYGYVSSLLLNLWLATRDQDVLDWACHLTDLTLEHMVDPETGWVLGYVNRLDRKWRGTPGPTVHVGAQLTAALSFLRLYHQTGDAKYSEQGIRLAEKLNLYGWDRERGGWYELIERRKPHRPVQPVRIIWWNQIYGSFLQLQLYRITGDEACLERFERSEEFWERYFRDRKHGGVLPEVSPDGEVVGDGGKASAWRTSYHEMEHALLNYLYLNLYVAGKPAVLHFNFEGPGKRFVSLIDDPSVKVSEVKVDGRRWDGFDPDERSVELPEGKGLKVEVRLEGIDHPQEFIEVGRQV